MPLLDVLRRYVDGVNMTGGVAKKTLSVSLKELEIVPVLPANQHLSPLALCGGSGVLYLPV